MTIINEDPKYSMAGKPARFEVRLSLLFAALFMPNAIYLSFFPLWLEYKSFTPLQISTMLTLPVFVRLLITPVFTHLADRAPERARVLRMICMAGFICSLLLFLPLGFAGVLSVVVMLAVFWSPQVPIADSIVLSGVRRYGTNYASIRLWGSVMFLVLNIAAGIIIQRTSPAYAIPLMVFGFGAIGLASLLTPKLGQKRAPAPFFRGGKDNVLRSAPVIYMLIATALIQGSHGFMYNFGSIYWTSLGVSAQLVGLLWAIQVLAEILLFHFYSKLFRRVRIEMVLMCAGAFGIVRWALFGFAGELDLGFAALALIQTFHAFTFGATYIAQQTYLSNTVPEEQASSAQGLSVFVHGLIMALVMFTSGPLYDAFQGHGFLAMIVVSVLGMIFSWRFASATKAENAKSKIMPAASTP
jgi:MFS transporter, PPP family, 3-phenylpropionic acid transporter